MLNMYGYHGYQIIADQKNTVDGWALHLRTLTLQPPSYSYEILPSHTWAYTWEKNIVDTEIMNFRPLCRK